MTHAQQIAALKEICTLADSVIAKLDRCAIAHRKSMARLQAA